MTLVSPKTFRKWQAVHNNILCVKAITMYRALATNVFPKIVTVEEQEQYDVLTRAMAQIDLLTNYLLDINYDDPLVSESKSNVGPLPEPQGE